VKRIIEISSLGMKPDKPGSYMQVRYLAEQVLKESGLDWTIIQPSVLSGKDAPFIKGLTDLIRSSPVEKTSKSMSVVFFLCRLSELRGCCDFLRAVCDASVNTL